MISVFIEDFVAPKILEWGKGYYAQKAVLLTALARASGIPSRMAFARIRDHRVPEKIVKMARVMSFPGTVTTSFSSRGGGSVLRPLLTKSFAKNTGHYKKIEAPYLHVGG